MMGARGSYRRLGVRIRAASLIAVLAFTAAACSDEQGEHSEAPGRTITPFVPRTPEPSTASEPDPTTAPGGTPAQQQDPQARIRSQVRTLLVLLSETAPPLERSSILRASRELNDPRLVIPLIHVWAFSPAEQRAEVAETVEAIAGVDAAAESEFWFFGWYDWMVANPDWPLPDSYLAWLPQLIQDRRGLTFHRFLRADQPALIRPELILWGGRPPDGVAPLDEPARAPAADATYLAADDHVFGLRLGGEARAYPVRVLARHEVVNDVVSGVPVLLTYDPLSDSGILYLAAGGSEDRTFGSSGLLYESTKLIYDRQTNSLWTHAAGEAVTGPLADEGIALTPLPLVRTTWAEWRSQHPDTDVIDIGSEDPRTYQPGATQREYLASEQINFPVGERDEVLPPKSHVFGLRVGRDAFAVPLQSLTPGAVLNNAVAEANVVLVVDAGGGVRAYRRGDYEFTAGNLAAASGPLTLQDQSGATWRVLEDELVSETDERLGRLAGHVTFWFSWRAYFPTTTLHGAP